MSQHDLTPLWLAWDRVDERLARIQERHAQDAEVPFYETCASPGASDDEIRVLASLLEVELPPELAESLRKWNGRWIAQDHMIALSPISDYLHAAAIEKDFQRRASARDKRERERMTFERVIGPINPKMESARRICFGSHEPSGSFLFLDFEDPPEGGAPGQVIRTGEDPSAECVAPSFVAFLQLVASAPLYDDDPEHDPLKIDDGRRAT